MANDSTVSGFLTPVAATPDYDDALDDTLHDTIVGVTGLTSDNVMPRWQKDDALLPAFGTNWCASGFTGRDPDVFAAEMHDGTGAGGLGTTDVVRTEELTALLSFYGPNADGMEAAFRDGMQLKQNRFLFDAVGLSFVDMQGPLVVPESIKMQWQRRVDVRVLFRRRTTRTFAIRNLNGADFTVYTDTGDIPPNINHVTNP